MKERVKGWRLRLDACPVASMSEMTKRVLGAGRLHAQDCRVVDVVGSSQNVVPLVLHASEWHRMKVLETSVVGAQAKFANMRG